MLFYPLGYSCPGCGDTLVSQKTSMRPDGEVMMESKCSSCSIESYYTTTVGKLLALYRSADVSPALDLNTFDQAGPPH